MRPARPWKLVGSLARPFLKSVSGENLCVGMGGIGINFKTQRQNSSFPHKRIEPSSHVEPQPQIQSNGFGIGFGHIEAQSGKVSAVEFLSAERNQRLANPLSSMLRQDTYLGYVSNIIFNARTQQHANHRARVFAHGHE